MNDTAQPRPTGEAMPPHPFRAAAWYDPRVIHQPCMCPRCRPPDPARMRLRPVRVALVVVGGALWPAVALAVNSHFHVVELGVVGHVGLLLAAAASLANLILCPTRRDPITGQVEMHAPRRTGVRMGLLLGALWSGLVWSYLALLMLPLLPISLLAILFFGLGLCGLTPYAALSVSLVQAHRAARLTAERLGRRATLLVVAAALLLPPLAGASAGLLAWRRQLRLEEQVALIARQAPHSEERARAIAGLAGDEGSLPALYPYLTDNDRQLAAAEAYLLLTDQPINEPVQRTAGPGRALIRPLWFLDGRLALFDRMYITRLPMRF